MKTLLVAAIAFVLSISGNLYAQNEYRYSLDLNQVNNDSLHVELLVPSLKQATLTFSFPKIIPGTYAISDYGKFINSVKAFDKAGKSLPVSKLSDDKWRIIKQQILPGSLIPYPTFLMQILSIISTQWQQQILSRAKIL